MNKTKKSLSISREVAFCLLFEKFFNEDVSFEDIFQLAYDLEDFPVDGDVEQFVLMVYNNSDEADEIISKYSTKRVISRIPKLDLAIMRIAIYEILHCKDIPTNVSISEAVRLASHYGTESDKRFINGVLGSFSRSDELKANSEESSKSDE